MATSLPHGRPRRAFTRPPHSRTSTADRRPGSPSPFSPRRVYSRSSRRPDRSTSPAPRLRPRHI
ncbi:hypothetical protein K523DRAFT_322145 [Schizophyllum commune Tattone D]|nr:hypothetical protein K523DRAFT_322145 [Schizophyllum commune Tattone D]